MLKHYLFRLKTGHLRALREQKGQSLIIFTFAFLGLVAMLGIALDLGLVYIEQVRVSRTTDAATLAGVVELPFEEDAMRRAIEFIELNGYEPGVDAEILIRGCVDTMVTSPVGPGNVSELGVDPAFPTDGFSQTTTITGAVVSEFVTAADPRATFLIDTLAFQPESGGCDPANGLYGNANKLQIKGVVSVRMNFMQFFGFSEVPVQDVAVAENITNLDVVVVFDVSGSMEYETVCYDCWVRTDPNNPDYPNNGYFNPLPYNAAWADTDSDGIADYPQSIPASPLCTQAPAAHTNSGFDYLVHEAELYSREVGNWDLDVRTQGQGFWVLQRGSRNPDNPNSPAEAGFYQGNQAGNPGSQSSNVCNPAVPGIDCTLGGTDNVCADDPGGDIYIADCSAYIKAHPHPAYSQGAGSDPKLQGASYDETCWTGGNSTCWDSNTISDPTRPSQALVPYVEYDFTPTWAGGQTHIWIRAIGGGDRAYQWNGLSPASLSGWKDRVYWQVGDLTNPVQENTAASAISGGEKWRDNRATNSDWDWIKLGSVATPAGQETLRIYQGSAGYKIDKIVFTNDPSSSKPSILGQNSDKGPAATPGSATRESCNLCNPAFGYTVSPGDCGCPVNATEAQAYDASGAYGSGGNACSNVVITGTNQLRDDLYHGIDPLRSAQEAVKNFAKRLNPQFDQIGIVPFTTDVVNGGAGAPSRAKLQCLNWANNDLGDSRYCYDSTFTTTPLSYTLVLEALERQWPQQSTDIGEGLREGLEELGVDAQGNPATVDSSCSTSLNDGTACDRRGAARKVLVLMTDGSPNQNPGSCNAGGGRPDLWNGDVGNGDSDYECALFFAKEAADAGVIVYTIGIGAGVNKDFLTAIATGIDPHSTSGIGEEFLFDARGGRFFNAAKPSDLDGIFSQILGNIYVRIVG